MKRKLLPLVALGLALVASPLVQSCSDQHTETTTTRTYDSSDPAPDSSTTTTTTTTTTTDEPDSVLGATFHAIGTVVLFPFRLVGDALGLIV